MTTTIIVIMQFTNSRELYPITCPCDFLLSSHFPLLITCFDYKQRTQSSVVYIHLSHLDQAYHNNIARKLRNIYFLLFFLLWTSSHASHAFLIIKESILLVYIKALMCFSQFFSFCFVFVIIRAFAIRKFSLNFQFWNSDEKQRMDRDGRRKKKKKETNKKLYSSSDISCLNIFFFERGNGNSKRCEDDQIERETKRTKKKRRRRKECVGCLALPIFSWVLCLIFSSSSSFSYSVYL